MSDVYGVVAYFNAAHAAKRLENFLKFRASYESAGIPLLVVELGYDGVFDLPEGRDVVRVSRGDVMWQKEHLLNIGAAAAIERGAKYVIATDADLLFQDDRWARRIVDQLDHAVAVQGFSMCHQTYSGESRRSTPSFVSQVMTTGQHKGPPGGLWGFRSEFFTHGPGLYAHNIIGGGDAVLGAGVAIDPDMHDDYFNRALMHYAIRLGFAMNRPLREHCMAWIRRCRDCVAGRYAVAEQAITTLPHGTTRGRAHTMRHMFMADYDPVSDVRFEPGQGLEWCTTKPALHAGVRGYFMNIRDDHL